MYDATAVFFANYFDFMWSEKCDTSSAPHPQCWLYHSNKFDSGADYLDNISSTQQEGEKVEKDT